MAGVPNSKEATFTDGSGSSGDCLNIDTSQGIVSIPNGKTLAFYSDAYTTITGQIKNGNFIPPVSSTAVAIANAGTIPTANIGVSRLNPAGVRTGIILAAGTLNGQQCWVVNEAAIGNYVQMDVSGTSNVADGINCILPGLSARLFVFDTGTNLWYQTAATTNGTDFALQSSTAPVITNGNTITTNGVGVARVAPGGAVTGILLQAGVLPGQQVVVINESAGANTVTFAASGTSNVAGGTGDIITGLTSAIFLWDGATNLWYRIRAS